MSVLAPLVERLPGHQRAEAQELGQHLARLDQHAHALDRRQRQVLVGHHRGVDHAAQKRGEAVAVAADGGDLHLGRRHLGPHQRGPRHHVRRRAGRGCGDGLAAQILDPVDAGAREHDIGRRVPVAAEQFHVGAARGRGDGAVDAFVAVDLAGQQRLHADGVVLDVEDVDLESFALGKAAFGRHEKEAGVGLGKDHGLPPRLEALRLRRESPAAPRWRQHRPAAPDSSFVRSLAPPAVLPLGSLICRRAPALVRGCRY